MSERIDGWKAIGAYFGRDRTTAIRWAASRGLPVRRMPGGKRATVYALKSDLDRWLAGQPDVDESDLSDSSEAPAGQATGRPSRRLLLIGGIAVAGAAAAGGGALLVRRAGAARSDATSLPRDPVLARLYLKGRDDWAMRTADSLGRAIWAFEETVRRAPDFAPAYVSLADALILAREFGTLDDADAFTRARRAAETAMRLDPGLSGAHRALGFILYWWDRDPPAAGKAFRRANRLSPRDGQTHFWYGNILADNGEHAAAMREFDAARLIEPGSIAIRTDLAWAIWCAGNRDEALAMLTALLRSNPSFAVIHDCLSIIQLADGDYAGYVGGLTELARLRGGGERSFQATTLKAALDAGAPYLQKALVARATADLAASSRRDHSWLAFLHSVSGDRAGMLSALKAAERREERWGDAGLVLRMTLRWDSDREIIGLLARRKAAPVE